MIRAPASRDHAAPPIATLAEVNAGRRRALDDGARLATIVARHAQLVGSDAVGAHDDALGAVEHVRTEGQAALPSSAAQAAWAERIAPDLADAATQIHRHSAAQAVVDHAAVAVSGIADAQTAAAESWRDPARFVQALQALAMLANSHVTPDASKADQARIVRGAVGGAVGMALDRALDAQEPEFAAHILSTWGETLPPAMLQKTIARLDGAARDARLARVFCEATAGHGEAAMPAAGRLAVNAPPGAGLHPLAGGEVIAVEGPTHDATISVRHPDGSTAQYGGVGLAAVTPGDLATPAQVLGSTRDTATVALTGADGQPIDPATWLDRAGGAGALIGTSATPRQWNGDEVLRRIAARNDISEIDRAAAKALAARRMAKDKATLAAGDRALSRATIALCAERPHGIVDATGLPDALKAGASPRGLAMIDRVLREAALTPATPPRNSPDALRLDILRRQSPDAFAAINLAPMIAAAHPADLAALAGAQAALAQGATPPSPADARAAVLDAMARHEWIGGAALSDAELPAILGDALVRMELDHTDPAAARAVQGHVADAIQSRKDRT